jgi:putative ABC transport system permease protein
MDIIPGHLRRELNNPNTFACYFSDLAVLGLQPNELCEIGGRSLAFRGTVPGKQYTVPYVVCSIETAERILPAMSSSQTNYIVAKCHNPMDVTAVAETIKDSYPGMTAYSKAEMLSKIRQFILLTSKTGLVILCVTIFCVSISIFVTSQTVYAATIALKNEIAVLDALGISMSRLSLFVLCQALIVGVLGLLVSFAIAYLVIVSMSDAGLPIEIDPWVYLVGSCLSGFTVVVSTLIAQRSLRLIEPAELLH